MKKAQLLKSILIGFGFLVATSAMAADGTLSVSGNVVTKTCSINGTAQGTLVNVTIPLGTVSTASFASAGKTGGIVNGGTGISLTNCGNGTVVNFTLDGSGSIDAATGTYKNTTGGGATNMAAQVVNTITQTGINANGSNNISVTADATGNATIPVGVRYYSLGAAGAGAFTALASFNLLYP